MSAAAIAVGVAAAASIGTGIASSQAQKGAAAKAGKLQAMATQQALDQQRQGIGDITAAVNQARSDMSPFLYPGRSAAQLLQEELHYLNGQYTPEQYRNDPGYTHMVNSLESLQAEPGYQYQLEQGLQGVNNSAAARGGLLSGQTLKELTRYGQGLAQTSYQQAWERSQRAYQAAFERDQAQKMRISNTLGNLAGMAQNAAGSMGNFSMSGANQKINQYNNMANTIMGGGQAQANSALQQGQAQANMYGAINQGVQGLAGGVASMGTTIAPGTGGQTYLQSLFGSGNGIQAGPRINDPMTKYLPPIY